MQLKNIEVFTLKAVVYLAIIFALPFYLGNYLDSFLHLPRIFNYPINLLGLVPITLGLIIDFSSIESFLTAGKGTPFPWRPPRKLVDTGTYRYTRNPIYLAYALIMSGFAIFTNLLTIFIVVSAFMAAIHFGVIYWEEKQLEKRFGRSYLEYKKKVPRWILKFG